MSDVITTHRLTKVFGDTTAVSELSFSVREGEVFGYLGPNGAGKTTTIRLLLDLIRPTTGHAKLLGSDVKGQNELHRQVGYVPGDLALYGRLTADEHFKYFASLRDGVEWSYVRRLTDRFDLDTDRPIGDLSTGNRQKVGLVLAFMHRPKLLLMDEPAASLDPFIKRELFELIGEMTEAGATIFSPRTGFPRSSRSPIA